MKELDLVFRTDLNLKVNNIYTICNARDIKTNKVTVYKRKNMRSRDAMNSIISYLQSKGYEIYNVTFTELNIG